MIELMQYIQNRYLSDEKGQGMVEYALILAVIVVIAVALGTSNGIQGGIMNTFNNVKNAL